MTEYDFNFFKIIYIEREKYVISLELTYLKLLKTNLLN